MHVQHADGEVRFRVEPRVELCANYGLTSHELAEAQRLVEEHLDEISRAWARHFSG